MTARVIGLKRRRSTTKSQTPEGLPSVRLGKLLAIAQPAGVWVEIGPERRRALARLGIECDARRLERAIARGQSVALAFEDADPTRPIVLGMLGGGFEHDQEQAQEPQPREREVTTAQAEATSVVVEADADGQRVRVEAKEEIVLQCGEASISLKRNGRVVIRGRYIETYASGTNRIKGGNVRIN